jgi:hypothetical protein
MQVAGLSHLLSSQNWLSQKNSSKVYLEMQNVSLAGFLAVII